jgi:hypothetical protein
MPYPNSTKESYFCKVYNPDSNREKRAIFGDTAFSVSIKRRASGANPAGKEGAALKARAPH